MTPLERGMLARTRQLLKPPPKLALSEWADQYRMLSPEASSEPGRWNTARAEYQRGMMDAVSDPSTTEVVLMTSAQIGKTELVLNLLGFHIAQDPAPILVVQPTLDMAEAFSKDRLAPMLRDTPALQGRVKDARARESGNTILHKAYPGGQLTMAGANSPASLASRPKRLILCDEVDRYPFSAGTEGDPVELARKRAATFYNRKVVLVSTPTVKGISRIEKAFEASDQRHYHLACPHCDHRQTLRWSHVKWPEGRPEQAYYVCAECGSVITDADKARMLRGGVWIASKPFTGVAGFHINELYSPWRKFGDVAADFLKAKRKGREALQVWTNTSLGEVWEDQAGEQTSWESLMARCEPYKPLTVPMGGLVLTAGVDVQHNRLAVVIRAWGEGEQSWLVYQGELYGDPLQPQVWRDLDQLLETDFEHASGATLRVTATAVDSGDGTTTQAVYAYCWDRRERNVIAIKGASTPGLPVRGKPSAVEIDHRGKKVRGAQVWFVGTDTAKAQIYARLRLVEGAGSYHFPIGTDPEYFQQLTAEKRVTKLVKGFPKPEWVKTRPRNEALDCEVYCLASAYHAGIQRLDAKAWARLTNRLAPVVLNEQVPADTSAPPEAGPAPAAAPEQRRQAQRPRRDAGGWVNGWKRW